MTKDIKYTDHSACKTCGKIADLINGLCIICWNKKVAPNSRANLKLPVPKEYTPVGLNIPDFTDKYGRRWSMLWPGCIGVVD